MKAYIRKFCDYGYTTNTNINSLEDFEERLNGMFGLGIMVWIVNGVKFIDRGQLVMENYSKRSELLGGLK